MPNFAKKCKKQLRRILCSKVFSCVFSRDIKDSLETPSVSSETIASQKLEILLLKTLKTQLEEREYHDQLKNTLFQITQILEQIGRNYDLHQKLSQRFLNDGFSNFTITVSKDRLIHCQADARKKSLVVLNEGNNNSVCKGSSVILHKCQNEFSLSENLFPKGTFSSILYRVSNDKGVQYDPKLNVEASFRRNSKLIQTHQSKPSNFNFTSFKYDLIKHIRILKYDVVTLRQLLFSLEQYPASCRLNAKDVSICTPIKYSWKEEFDYKFFEAKTRAANFVKFYKLRKLEEKKKKGPRRRQKQKSIWIGK